MTAFIVKSAASASAMDAIALMPAMSEITERQNIYSGY
jgi:hypothetical protein